MRTGDVGKRERKGQGGEKDAVARFRAAFNVATREESTENDTLAAGLQCVSLYVIAWEFHGVANERADERVV